MSSNSIENVVREAVRAALKAYIAAQGNPAPQRKTTRAQRQKVRWASVTATADPTKPAVDLKAERQQRQQEAALLAGQVFGSLDGLTPYQYLATLKAAVDNEIGTVEFGGVRLPFSKTVAWGISAPVVAGLAGCKAGEVVALTEGAGQAAGWSQVDTSKAHRGHGWGYLVRSAGGKDAISASLKRLGFKYRGEGKWVIDGAGVGPSRRFGRKTGRLDHALHNEVADDGAAA